MQYEGSENNFASNRNENSSGDVRTIVTTAKTTTINTVN
jgi:hypothetical protein